MYAINIPRAIMATILIDITAKLNKSCILFTISS